MDTNIQKILLEAARLQRKERNRQMYWQALDAACWCLAIGTSALLTARALF